MPAPIALFVYNRPDHMRRTLEALAMNGLADQSALFVFSDGPRKPEDVPRIEEVRAVGRAANGFARVTLVASTINQGLSRSITGGVSRLTREFDRVIVLEDDILTSPWFLTYMNEALDKYAEDERVAAISGYIPAFDAQAPETFFQRDAECWGWATWRRGWALFNPDGRTLLAELQKQGLLRFFDQDGTSNYVDMLKAQIAGKNDSWAVRWRASVILANRLSLYPGRTLTENIGFDGSGVHSDDSKFWQAPSSRERVVLSDIPVVHSGEAFELYRRFNRRHGMNSLSRRIKGKVRAVLRRLGS